MKQLKAVTRKYRKKRFYPKIRKVIRVRMSRQGTAEIYNNLDLTYLGDESYEATIGIFRLGQLDGVAKIDGETLSFEDEDMQVKGIITIQDNMAVLTITESGFEYINQGEVFEFSEKLQQHEYDTNFNIRRDKSEEKQEKLNYRYCYDNCSYLFYNLRTQ